MASKRTRIRPFVQRCRKLAKRHEHTFVGVLFTDQSGYTLILHDSPRRALNAELITHELRQAFGCLDVIVRRPNRDNRFEVHLDCIELP